MRQVATMGDSVNTKPIKTSASLQYAMVKLLKETDSADVTLVCEDKEWQLHSAVLEMRSPFFKAAIANEMKEKNEKKIVINDLDPKTVEDVVNYMHGIPIAGGSVPALLEAAERFQMMDMKEEVAMVAVKSISKENVLELGYLAERYKVEQLLKSCERFIVDESVKLSIEEAEKMPRLSARILDTTRKERILFLVLVVALLMALSIALSMLLGQLLRRVMERTK